MYDNGNWCLNLGRWWRVHVRMHMFFLLFAAFTCFLAWRTNTEGQEEHAVSFAALSLAILAISVLAHEIGHVLAARRVGGRVDEIVLGPLGGMGSLAAPHDPRAEVIVHLAGPLTNSVICLFCATILLGRQDVSLVGLMHPLQPQGLTYDGPWWLMVAKLAFWINWVLLLLNLIPAFPFDGGRALRAGLSLFWLRDGRRFAGVIVGRLAQLGSIGLLVTAWILRHAEGTGPVPVWFALVLLSIFLFFSARQFQDPQVDDPDDEGHFEYDFSQDYLGLDHREDSKEGENGLFARWIEHRRQAKILQQKNVEAEDELNVDEILARLHEHGMQSLSREDRKLLDRVSARYRNRLGPRA